MNTQHQAFLTTNSLTHATKAAQINKTDENYMENLFIYLITIVLLLMAGSASSGVMDDIKADMQLNEAPLLNAPVGPGWAKQANIVMGGAPRGDATPVYWTPANPDLKSSRPWNVIAPWFTIFPGVDNAATNVRIKIFGIKISVLQKSTNVWKRIDTGLGAPTWAGIYSFDLITRYGSANKRVESDGLLSYKFDAAFHPIHGGMAKFDLEKNGVDPSDIAAVFVDLKTQLILDNPLGIDDRARAQILVSVGADYYPTMTTKIADFSPMKYVPSSGASRFGLIKTVPKSHYFSTIDPPGTYDTISEYTKAGGLVAIPVDQFEANLPPYLFDKIAPTTPTSLALKLAKSSASATVTLSWAASSDNLAVTGYNIYRNGTKIGATVSTNFKDTLSGAASGALYNYTVKAFDDAGNLSASSSLALGVY